MSADLYVCSYSVLSLVNEERNAYGLRSNEYGRYQYAMNPLSIQCMF